MSDEPRAPDGLSENLRRVPDPPPDGVPPASLRSRIEASLAGRLARGEGDEARHATCYNEPPSEGTDAALRREGDVMSLQACPRCGAKFDVSSFAAGQKFSCGACGEVITAHASAPPQPPRPAVRGRTPGSRSSSTPSTPKRAERRPEAPRRGERRPAGPSRTSRRMDPAARTRPASGAGSRRGPQYQPPQRQQDPHAARAGPAARRRDADRDAGRRRTRERGAPSREARQGTNPALYYGAGALVVVAVLAFLLLGTGGKKPAEQATGPGGGGGRTPAEQPDPEVPPDTYASLVGELRANPPGKAEEYRRLARRFLDVGGAQAEAEARRLYQELVDRADPNDGVARRYLGYTDFQADILGRVLEVNEEPIPEAIFNRRGYPFLTAVEEFHQQRWLDDEEEIELARQAVDEMREHARRLLEDREYAAQDRIRANIANDPFFRDYNYATRWARPYLICYSSKERLSQFDLLKEKDRAERRRMQEEMRENRRKWEKVLDEKAQIFTQLYAEYMRRYGERFGLRDLMDEWGGRPDYPQGVRSFQDGVPLVVWIFTDHEAFIEYHAKVKGDNIAPFVAGYFSPQTEWIYLYDEANQPDERVAEINKNVHEGVHQLEHWFTRQLNRWAKPKFSQDFFSEGIAEYIGAVKMDRQRNLEFIGFNVPRLHGMQQMAHAFEQQGRDFPVFPVERLTWFNSYGAVQQWGVGEWGINPGAVLGIFYQQSTAFVLFLNEYENGKYQDEFMAYFEGVLMRETGLNQNQAVFMRAFGIRDEDDWDDLDQEFQTFLKEDLLKRPIGPYRYTPPQRDEWDD